MGLTLELVSSNAEQPPSATRKVFTAAGGTIGRAKHSDWVLPNSKVSSRHARISCENSTFYIEDTSTNGTYLNSPDNRLASGQLYPLHTGDRLIIEPYEVAVSITSDRDETRIRPHASTPRDAGDPFRTDDLFGPGPLTPRPPAPGGLFESVPESQQDSVVDPLILLGAAPKSPAVRPQVAAKDLEAGSLLSAHFRPPVIAAPPAPAPSPAPVAPPVFIPDNYDPLAPETRSVPAEAVFEALAASAPPGPAPPPSPPAVPVVAREAIARAETVSAPAISAPPAAPGAPGSQAARHRRPPVPPPPTASAVSGDLAAVLAAAGLENVPVTSELAQKFGEILRIVVMGVMDILRSRQQVKDEFRMRMTYFRPVDNNPLKFSVNVDDALHNLLVKRNEAYLGPVEAFEDAFDDLRNHQLAMLAGMRVAFERTLAEFDPDRLQEEFDRQLKKGSVFAVGGKLRYWDLFRERRAEIVRDPEASFRELFGEAFTKAYEAQLKQLKEEHGRG